MQQHKKPQFTATGVMSNPTLSDENERYICQDLYVGWKINWNLRPELKSKQVHIRPDQTEPDAWNKVCY